jgi:hypothetical protein
MTAEGAEDFIEVRGDEHLVVEKVLEPQIIVTVRQGDQGQQVSETDANARFLLRNGEIVLRQGIDAKMRGHS